MPKDPLYKRLLKEREERLNSPIPGEQKDDTLLQRFRCDYFFAELQRRIREKEGAK